MNENAVEKYKELNLGNYPSRTDKIKYRLWLDQKHYCAYSNKAIPLESVFTAQVEIDHILPYKKSLDDSYMNKVLCYVAENRNKGDKTPKDAWSGNEDKWNQITQTISRWKGVDAKVKRFYQTESDLQQRDFISSQLNDTRYIAKLALNYIKQLGCDVSVTKGFVVSNIRHQWGLNSLIGETDKKERTDHRHHAIDAVVIAATSRSLYNKAVNQIENNKLHIEVPYANLRSELDAQLKQMVVSHASQRKLSGGLHAETGAGYIEKHHGLVYRKVLSPEFTVKNASSIVDEAIQGLVVAHLAKYGDDPKKAFAEKVTLYHKDNKTPIKRVRVLQSKTTKKELKQNKFGVKDKSGKVFKYMTYGNTHHVEIFQNKETGKFKGEFITMMEAHRRAMTNTKSATKRKVHTEKIINTQLDGGWQFIMAIHKNDLVSVKVDNDKRQYYRVQKLSGGYDLTLRLHSETTSKREKVFIDSKKMIENSIENFMVLLNLKLHHINAIGAVTDG